MSQAYDNIIAEAARRTGLSIEQLRAVIGAESGYNPNAVSRKGAQGLMQLMPDTGAEMHKKGGYQGPYNPYDPAQNINIGADYLAAMMRKYGNPDIARAAYNYGPGNIDAIIRKTGSTDFNTIRQYLPGETKSYVEGTRVNSTGISDAERRADGVRQLASRGAEAGIDALTTSANAGSSVYPVGTAANGGTLMSNGTVAPMSPTGLGGPPVEAGTPGFSIGEPSTAGYISAAITAGKGIHRAFTDRLSSSKDQDRNFQTSAAMTAANLYTAGLASVADSIFGGKISKGIGKVVDINNKVTDLATFGLTKKLRNKIFHQSTRGHAMQNTAELAKDWKGNEKAMEYLAGMRAQYNEGPADKTKQFAGKYASWDDYVKGGLEAKDLTGVYGNLKVFGPEWAGLTQAQREAVTQGLIDKGLYNSKKGDVVITDEELAKQIRDDILKSKDIRGAMRPGPQTGPNGTKTTASNSNGVAPTATNSTTPQKTGNINNSNMVNYPDKMPGSQNSNIKIAGQTVTQAELDEIKRKLGQGQPVARVGGRPTPGQEAQEKLAKIKNDMEVLRSRGANNDAGVSYVQNLQNGKIIDKSEASQIAYNFGGVLDKKRKTLGYRPLNIFAQ